MIMTNIKGYYYIDLKTLLENKEDIMSLFEKFVSNL